MAVNYLPIIFLSFYLLHTTSGFFQSGDVIVGMLLPLTQSSGDKKCAVYDLDSVIKVEAVKYAVKELNKVEVDERIGYDIIDICSKASPQDWLNFAENKWLKGASNSTIVPMAIITDLPNVDDFHSLGAQRIRLGREMPLISLKYRQKARRKSYSMSAPRDSSARAIYAMVRHLDGNILDLIQYGDDFRAFEDFKEITRNSDVCLLNEAYFTDDGVTWLEQGRRQSPIAILFSMGDKIPVDELSTGNLTHWNIILGNEVPHVIHNWPTHITGVVGIRKNHGNVENFEKYLKISRLFNDAFQDVLCSRISTDDCSKRKEQFIVENSHLGADVIDAVYAVIKSRQTGTHRLPQTGLTGIRVKSATGKMVSFHGNDMTRYEVDYDILNFKERSLFKVGEIKLRPKVEVNFTHAITWKNENIQNMLERCSIDCEPGTWKKNWERVGRCCWDCVKCTTGTVSSYVNSTQCKECPVGTKASLDQSKCRPPYVDYLKWYEPFTIIMIFLLVFETCFLVYAVNIVAKKANTPVILRSKSATLPFLLSLYVTLLLPVVLLMKPSPSTCGAYNVIFMFSLGTPLTFLIARSHFVLDYCYGDNGDLKRKWFCCSPQTIISLLLIILQLVIVIIVLSIIPPNVLTYSSPSSDVEYIECASHSRPEFLPLVFFILLLTMVFNILHVKEENSPINHYEVKFVSFGIFLLYAIIFVYFVAVFGIDGKTKVRVLCSMAYLFGLVFFATVFLPKLYIILYKPDDNQPVVNPILMDENENVAEMSKRESVDSPLFDFHSCPYGHTEV